MILFAIVALFAVAALAEIIVHGRETSEKRNNQLLKYVAEEHERNLEVCRQLVTMTESWGAEISRAALRETEDTRTVIESLVGDRKYLLTALVSLNADPRAAQRLGLVAQATERPPSVREMLDDVYEGARREATENGYGEPIVPVGFAGS